MNELGSTLEDIHAEIGRIFVVWGWLEGEMIDAKINWRHVSPEETIGPLKTFLVDLVEPRGVRNAIAHGLASACSNPWDPDFEPYVTCRTPDMDTRKITLSDLRRTRTQLERLRNVLREAAPLMPSKSRR